MESASQVQIPSETVCSHFTSERQESISSMLPSAMEEIIEQTELFSLDWKLISKDNIESKTVENPTGNHLTDFSKNNHGNAHFYRYQRKGHYDHLYPEVTFK